MAARLPQEHSTLAARTARRAHLQQMTARCHEACQSDAGTQEERACKSQRVHAVLEALQATAVQDLLEDTPAAFVLFALHLQHRLPLLLFLLHPLDLLADDLRRQLLLPRIPLARLLFPLRRVGHHARPRLRRQLEALLVEVPAHAVHLPVPHRRLASVSIPRFMVNVSTELAQLRRLELVDVLPGPPISRRVHADAAAFVVAAAVHEQHGGS